MIGPAKRTRSRFRDLDTTGSLPEAHEGRFARAVITTLMLFLAALLVWAAATPVNEITTGRGQIKTRAPVERVEHPDGGVVARLDVVAGQHVEKGATLLVFETLTLGRELEKLQAAEHALNAELGRLAFVLEGKGTIPDFVTLDELTPEELLFWVEQSYLDAQLDLIDLDSRSILPAIGVLEARVDSLSMERGLLEERLVRNRAGQQSGAISRNAVEQLEREVLQMDRSILEVRGEILAQRNALAANDLRRSELFAKRQREAALRRSEIEERYVGVHLAMAEIETKIARAEVTATVSGTLMDVGVSHPREVVAPGELIAEIIPVTESLEAEIEISADRIGSVAVGMQARLKVLSYDFTRYGEIVGEVASISPSSFENAEGFTVFRVVVALPAGGAEPRLGDRPVLPGMTVTADILTDSKKILTYLLKPLRSLGDRAFTEA